MPDQSVSRDQQRGGAEQAGGVAVMAAGVHHAGRGGGVGDAGLLLDRQRVHVGAQTHAAVGLAPRDRGHHAVAAHAGHERHAQLGQPRGDERGGGLLVQRQLGVGVQVAPPLRERGCKRRVDGQGGGHAAVSRRTCAASMPRRARACRSAARRSGCPAPSTDSVAPSWRLKPRISCSPMPSRGPPPADRPPDAHAVVADVQVQHAVGSVSRTSIRPADRRGTHSAPSW